MWVNQQSSDVVHALNVSQCVPRETTNQNTGTSELKRTLLIYYHVGLIKTRRRVDFADLAEDAAVDTEDQVDCVKSQRK